MNGDKSWVVSEKVSKAFSLFLCTNCSLQIDMKTVCFSVVIALCKLT